MTTYLYTLPGCDACHEAKELLIAEREAYQEVRLDNPLVEIGAKLLFRDGKLHAPVLIRENGEAYVLSLDTPRRWWRIISLYAHTAPS